MNERLQRSLSEWNPWWWSMPRRAAGGVPRYALDDVRPWVGGAHVLAICGMRRAGKSTLMRQMIQHLLDSGTPASAIFFVDFEDPVFLEHDLGPSLMDDVVAAYLQAQNPASVPFLFLDEVQHLSGWARWVRAATDTLMARVVVSGSGRLFEPEIGKVLTGRSITKQLWPASFREYLRFLQKRPCATTLREYLRWGGLPAVLREPKLEKRTEILQQCFSEILYRDVVKRHGVRTTDSLERLAHHLITHTGVPFTFQCLRSRCELSMDQVRSYVRYLKECYLIHEVSVLPDRTRGPRKFYASDVGLRNTLLSQDWDRLAETVVATELLRDPDLQISYFLGDRQCDFVVCRGTALRQLIQVCFVQEEPSISEIDGLLEAMDSFGRDEAIVLTDTVDNTITLGHRTIRLIPLWRWLVEPGSPATRVPWSHRTQAQGEPDDSRETREW